MPSPYICLRAQVGKPLTKQSCSGREIVILFSAPIWCVLLCRALSRENGNSGNDGIQSLSLSFTHNDMQSFGQCLHDTALVV